MITIMIIVMIMMNDDDDDDDSDGHLFGIERPVCMIDSSGSDSWHHIVNLFDVAVRVRLEQGNDCDSRSGYCRFRCPTLVISHVWYSLGRPGAIQGQLGPQEKRT